MGYTYPTTNIKMMTFRRNATTEERQIQDRKYALRFNLPIEKHDTHMNIFVFLERRWCNSLWQNYIVPGLLKGAGVDVTQMSNEMLSALNLISYGQNEKHPMNLYHV